MAINFDINRGLENKKTASLVKGILIALSIILVVFVFLFTTGYFKIRPKNSKIESAKKKELQPPNDTVSVINNQKTQININENNAPINIGKQ